MKTKLNHVKILIPVVVVSILLFIIGLSCPIAAEEKKVNVNPSELPAVIGKAIERAFPKGQILTIEKEIEGEDPGQYDIEISSDGKEYEVEVSPEGNIIESKEIASAEVTEGEQNKKWTDSFGQEECTFASVGRNRFFVLEPGYQLVLESSSAKVVITVLNETKKIGNVETRIIEEREEEDGQLKEISRNFFAICKQHGDVFYFGEEVDIYKDGKIVDHEGQWRADDGNSQAGIIMPGTVLLGARYYQEIAPNAQDRAEIISTDVTMTTPAGTFKKCLKT